MVRLCKSVFHHSCHSVEMASVINMLIFGKMQLKWQNTLRHCRQSNDSGTLTTTESCAVRPALQGASQFFNIAVIALKWRPLLTC